MPVYLLSVASNEYTMVPNFEKPIKRELFRCSVAEYRNLMSHEVNFFGMVEPAVYVSSKQNFGTNFAYNFHCHGILWGCRPQTVERLCKDIRKNVYSSVPYLSPAMRPASTRATWLKFSGTVPNSQTSSINCGEGRPGSSNSSARSTE